MTPQAPLRDTCNYCYSCILFYSLFSFRGLSFLFDAKSVTGYQVTKSVLMHTQVPLIVVAIFIAYIVTCHSGRSTGVINNIKNDSVLFRSPSKPWPCDSKPTGTIPGL